MKTLKQTSKLKIAGIGFVALMCLLQFSCIKDHNDYIAPPPTALLMVTQASPDAPAEALFLDNNRVNNQSFNYGDNIGYFNAYIGARDVILYNYSSSAKIASDTIHLNQNTAYSLFLSNTYTSPVFTLLTDSLAQPAQGMATVRFVNVSPDAGAVDLFANNTKLVSNISYKGSTIFKPVTGNTSYNFEVRKTGTSTVLATLTSTNINTGSVYTVWLHGLAAGSGSTKLTVDIMKNAFY